MSKLPNSSIEEMRKKLSGFNTKYTNKDDDFWTLTTDNAGNGSAVIRFLPAPAGEENPIVKIYSHAFQGPGGWLFANSPTTIGLDCPINEMNQELWNSGKKEDKDFVSGIPALKKAGSKRKLNYIANILVIKDPAKPENDGKVFKFKFGPRIMEKLDAALTPPEDPIEQKQPINPFSLDASGANFKLIQRKKDNYPNYDTSEFTSPVALGSEKDQMTAWSKAFSLADIVSPDKFVSYGELKAKLNRVMKWNTTPVSEQREEREFSADNLAKVKEPEAKTKTPPYKAAEEDEDFFKSMLEDDDIPF